MYINLIINPSKKVHFNRRVHVILIPSLEDLREDLLIDILWYNENDYILFQSNKDE
jgi:hypothetical protein